MVTQKEYQNISYSHFCNTKNISGFRWVILQFKLLLSPLWISFFTKKYQIIQLIYALTSNSCHILYLTVHTIIINTFQYMYVWVLYASVYVKIWLSISADLQRWPMNAYMHSAYIGALSMIDYHSNTKWVLVCVCVCVRAST